MDLKLHWAFLGVLGRSWSELHHFVLFPNGISVIFLLHTHLFNTSLLEILNLMILCHEKAWLWDRKKEAVVKTWIALWPDLSCECPPEMQLVLCEASCEIFNSSHQQVGERGVSKPVDGQATRWGMPYRAFSLFSPQCHLYSQWCVSYVTIKPASWHHDSPSQQWPSTVVPGTHPAPLFTHDA